MVNTGLPVSAIADGFAIVMVATFVWGIFAAGWTVIQRLTAP